MACKPLQSWQRTLTGAAKVLYVEGGSYVAKLALGLDGQFAPAACSSRIM